MHGRRWTGPAGLGAGGWGRAGLGRPAQPREGIVDGGGAWAGTVRAGAPAVARAQCGHSAAGAGLPALRAAPSLRRPAPGACPPRRLPCAPSSPPVPALPRGSLAPGPPVPPERACPVPEMQGPRRCLRCPKLACHPPLRCCSSTWRRSYEARRPGQYLQKHSSVTTRPTKARAHLGPACLRVRALATTARGGGPRWLSSRPSEQVAPAGQVARRLVQTGARGLRFARRLTAAGRRVAGRVTGGGGGRAMGPNDDDDAAEARAGKHPRLARSLASPRRRPPPSEAKATNGQLAPDAEWCSETRARPGKVHARRGDTRAPAPWPAGQV